MGFSIQESGFDIVHFEVADSTSEDFKELEFSIKHRQENLIFVTQKR